MNEEDDITYIEELRRIYMTRKVSVQGEFSSDEYCDGECEHISEIGISIVNKDGRFLYPWSSLIRLVCVDSEDNDVSTL